LPGATVSIFLNRLARAARSTNGCRLNSPVRRFSSPVQNC